MAEAMRALLLLLLPCVLATSSILPPPGGPVHCNVGTFDCTVTNACGSFNDRTTCHASQAVYPRTEAELVAAVASAAREKRKAKAVAKYSHSLPKLVCPGGSDGVVISTALLSRVVGVDVEKKQITVQSGMLLRDLVAEAAKVGLSLPASPYFYGVTIGGLLATGAHGSSLMGRGGAVHEYVVGMRIVTPSTTTGESGERLAVVRELRADDPDLDAAKVSLGVLGVISQVTLQLEPLFKRSVTFVTNDSDADLAEMVDVWGLQHEFGDIMWLPGQGKVVLRKDDRVDISTPGDGLNLGMFRDRPSSDIARSRLEEEQLQEKGSDAALCSVSHNRSVVAEKLGFGLTNDGKSFTGYPVVGYQHRIQAYGSCQEGPDDDGHQEQQLCPWNPRINGSFIYNPGLSVTRSKAKAFIKDVLTLRDLNPDAFCGLDMHSGILFRYVKSSTAYLGKAEDSVELDMAYYRSRVRGTPAMHADVFDELEQMALYKYGALPHWGKSRSYAFNETRGKYPKLGEFLDVKARFDPDGVFSSEWSDQVLGINGSPMILGPDCAVEGLCTCIQDSDCASGYVCSPGKLYPDARVCSIPHPQSNIAQL
ncbi:hypothetical protein HU200_048414 [Digitaria exilis]|uniref:L-gulonolactone oxidase n=1 Tax=Digitaria exilis TaxID=1010633 RepID=A0A835AW82_9POAL|nr:hypothetical protein HU200_048414 [Digitaria exilis]CAB3496754.1 unnamed protein product [Digitaria exilis]